MARIINSRPWLLVLLLVVYQRHLNKVAALLPNAASIRSPVLTQHHKDYQSGARYMSSISAGDMSARMREIQSSLKADEKTQLMLDALRGKNLNDGKEISPNASRY